MRVAQIWRYPVKSMGGEQLQAATIGELGVEGDRRWAVVESESGRFVTAKRDPRLLFASARLIDDGVEIWLPDGRTTSSNADLSSWLGVGIELVRATTTSSGTFESPRDVEHEADWITWSAPPGVWHDSGRTRVSLVSKETLGAWDVRRFRPNVVLEGGGEDALVGSTVRVGSAVLDVVKQIDRCIVVTRPQPGLERDLEVLRTINRERSTFLAVGALVRRAGRFAVGDAVESIAPDSARAW